jgi:hypothetical protein
MTTTKVQYRKEISDKSFPEAEESIRELSQPEMQLLTKIASGINRKLEETSSKGMTSTQPTMTIKVAIDRRTTFATLSMAFRPVLIHSSGGQRETGCEAPLQPLAELSHGH